MEQERMEALRKGIKITVLLGFTVWFVLNLDTVRSFSIGLWEGSLAFVEDLYFMIYYETEVFVQLVIVLVILFISVYVSVYRLWQKPLYVHSDQWKIDKYIGRVAWIKGSDKGIIYGVWHLSRRSLWALVNLVLGVIHGIKLMLYGIQKIGGTDPSRPQWQGYKHVPKGPFEIPIGDRHYSEGPVIYFRKLGCFWRDVFPWKTPKIYYSKSAEKILEGTWKIVLDGYNLLYVNKRDLSKSHFELGHDVMGKHGHEVEEYTTELKEIELESQSMVEKAIGSDSDTAKEEKRKFTVLHPREILKENR